jgi:hypothetical protein
VSEDLYDEQAGEPLVIEMRDAEGRTVQRQSLPRSKANNIADLLVAVGGDPAKVTEEMLASINVTRDLFSTFMLDHHDNLRKLGRDREFSEIMLNPETADADRDLG